MLSQSNSREAVHERIAVLHQARLLLVRWCRYYAIGIAAFAMAIYGVATAGHVRDGDSRAKLWTNDIIGPPRFPPVDDPILVVIDNGIVGDGRLEVASGRAGESFAVSVDPAGSSPLQDVLFAL